MTTQIIKSTLKQIELHLNTVKLTPIFVMKNEPIASKSHFYFPLLVITLCNLYGIAYLHYESTGSLDWHEWVNSPYIYLHQWAPRSIWAQYDLVMVINIVAAFIANICLIKVRNVNSIYLIYEEEGDRMFVGEKVLSSDVQVQLAKVKKKLQFCCQMINLQISSITVAAYVNVYINSAYSLNVGSFFFWFIVIPLYAFYAAIAFTTQLGFVLFALCEIVRIRQQDLLEKLVQLNHNFPHKSIFLNYWRFKYLNTELLHICGQTREYARVCLWRLSMMFPIFIAVQCYFTYIVFYVRGNGISSFFNPLLCGSIVMQNLLMLWLIGKCASLARNYRRIEIENQKFYLQFIQIYKRYDRKCVGNLIKVETLQTRRRLRPYAFCVFGNFRITSKSYEMIISYMSAFFMFVIKNQYG